MKEDIKILINQLYERRTKGVKFGLEKITLALERLGSPHHSFNSIHIAGTNGKGSVAKVIYSLLRAHGEKTGVFTSPHLVRFTERVVVDDKEISEEEVLEVIKQIDPYCRELTFFEYVTVMAFFYFKEKGVRYAVVETGMGGRLDATNVLKPLVSVITSIGFDHQEFLGNDIVSIAKEKAGIIKFNVPVVSAKQCKEAEEVLKEVAAEKKSKLYLYAQDFFSKLKFMNFDGVFFDFYSFDKNLYDLFLPLTGFHQVENASLALKAFLEFYPYWEEKFIKEGLKEVKISGRLEILSKEPLVILDVAHNPLGWQTLLESLRYLTEKKPVLVFGVMKDKDVRSFIEYFKEDAYQMIFTVPRYDRSLRYEELLIKMDGFYSKIEYIPEPEEAFKEALSRVSKDKNLYLLCTGSNYLVGHIKEFLGEKSLHRTLGELM
ncbi:MAG: bifunctional folylpolyglutamate synthase/dihydrofolate synthase [Thermodesulfovibrio sp.]|nr:bifunctional folylpolyglutamate synthase/dihydrofolate synthase [Thermodesulfovibrio sp.]